MEATVPGLDIADAAQALHADPSHSEAAGRAARRLRRRTELPADCRSAACGRPLLHRRRGGARGAACASSAKPRACGCSALVGSDRPVRQGQRAVVPGDRRRRAAGGGADRRRRRCRGRIATTCSTCRPCAAMLRLEDNYSSFRDEIDGVYLRLKPDADVTAAAATRARHSRRVASRRRRLLAGRPGRAPRRAAAHQAHLRHRHGRARVDLAARRRHRDHEHHAGQRARADAARSASAGRSARRRPTSSGSS